MFSQLGNIAVRILSRQICFVSQSVGTCLDHRILLFNLAREDPHQALDALLPMRDAFRAFFCFSPEPW